MNFIHQEGIDRGKVLLFTLSTCIWCRKTKAFLEESGIAYSYIFVDELDGEEKEKIREEMKKWNPSCSYPTLVVNNEKCIVGFDVDAIKKEFKA